MKRILVWAIAAVFGISFGDLVASQSQGSGGGSGGQIQNPEFFGTCTIAADQLCEDCEFMAAMDLGDLYSCPAGLVIVCPDNADSEDEED